MDLVTNARATRTTGASTGLREWIRDHDDKWLFVAIYLGMAVGLSVFVSLFWLLAVAGLHLALELVRQAQTRTGAANVFLHALWEIKLDLGLILLALALVVYIDVVLGLLGIQSAARAAAATRMGVRVSSRAAAWERNLRTFLLTVDEMARIVYAAVMLRSRGKGGASAPVAKAVAAPKLRATTPAWRRRWGLGDRIGVALVVIGLFFIVVGPWLTPHDVSSMMATLLSELQPLPSS